MSSSSSCGGQHGQMYIPPSQALKDKTLKENLGRIRHKLFIMSGKGGVGKSSVTVNLGAALAQKGFAAGILDVDLHGPSVPRLLGLTDPVLPDAAGRMLPVSRDKNLRVLSMDSLLEDRDSAVLWRGPMKSSAIRQFLTDAAWGELDYLLIDSPPGTGDEHMTVLDIIPDAECIVVTTPQEISLADVRKALDFLRHVKANLLGVVENMSGLVCPHCGGKIDLFRQGGGQILARDRGARFLGAVPLDPAAVVAADRGVPVVLLEGEHPAKTAFLNLAEAVIAAEENK